jgi:hypothetical protein
MCFCSICFLASRNYGVVTANNLLIICRLLVLVCCILVLLLAQMCVMCVILLDVIIEDSRHQARYWMLVDMVDVIFSNVARLDQIFLSFPCCRVSETLDCHIVVLSFV